MAKGTIEQVVSWETFTHSIAEAARLVQPASFDHLPLIADGYSQVGRDAPRLLESFAFNAAPTARHVLAGIDTLRALNQANARVIPPERTDGLHQTPLGATRLRRRWRYQPALP